MHCAKASGFRLAKVPLALSVVALIAGLLIPHAASAHGLIYVATLSGADENPANSSAGSGFVRVTIDFDLFTMRIQARFGVLQGGVTAAHIHAATSNPLSGSAGVATQLPSFEGFPADVASGAYDHTF